MSIRDSGTCAWGAPRSSSVGRSAGRTPASLLLWVSGMSGGISPLTAMFAPAGAGLGEMPSTDVVEALGLPVIGDESPRAAGESSRSPVGSEPRSSGGQQPVMPQPEDTASSETTPFVLGEDLPTVLARLVRKIEKGEYVDMADLLRDNAEAERRRVDQELAPGETRRPRREVPDLLSWIRCFSSYAGIVARQQPGKTRELFAYMAMVVREARHCGGGAGKNMTPCSVSWQ